MVAGDNLREFLLWTQAIQICSLKISIKIRRFLGFNRHFHHIFKNKVRRCMKSCICQLDFGTRKGLGPLSSNRPKPGPQPDTVSFLKKYISIYNLYMAGFANFQSGFKNTLAISTCPDLLNSWHLLCSSITEMCRFAFEMKGGIITGSILK